MRILSELSKRAVSLLCAWLGVLAGRAEQNNPRKAEEQSVMKANRTLIEIGKRCGLGVAALAVGMVFSGCGTTSGLKSTAGGGAFNLAKFDQVLVLDFTNAVPAAKLKPDKVPLVVAKGRQFADLVTAELVKTKAFTKVARAEAPAAGNLIVGGAITRCTEGSAAARLWIGMGAGSSYFDAQVVLADGATGECLGELVVDKNSWPLGGGLASKQTVDTFMQGAAEKLARELAKAKAAPSQARVGLSRAP